MAPDEAEVATWGGSHGWPSGPDARSILTGLKAPGSWPALQNRILPPPLPAHAGIK